MSDRVPEQFLQEAMVREVREDKPNLIRAFARRLTRNFDAIDARFPITESNIGYDRGSVWMQAPVGATGATTAAQYDLYLTRIVVGSKATLTGIRYQVGGTAAGNARARLYNSAGTLVASSTSGTAQSGVLAVNAVPFSAAYSAGPGVYFTGLQFSLGTSTFVSVTYFQGAALDASPTDMTAPASVTPIIASRAAHPLNTTY